MEENQIMGTAAETAAETADNAAAAEVVAPQEESAQQGAEQQATEGNQPTEGSEKPKQSRGKNDHYAKLRRKADSYDSQSEGIMALARSKGLQPKDASEALEMLQADHKGQTLEEYRTEQETAAAAEERLVKGSRYYQELQRKAEQDAADAESYRVQRQMQEDLAAIQAVDPNVKSLESLEGYTDLVERGITGVDAYYLLQGKKAAQAAAMPPSPGKVGGTDETGRDFTGEELDHLTGKDLDDPSILKKALRSLRGLR
ncbi:MAG: hypothetical protein IJN80_05195 [Clostridia bacterium]|nr:hypothetical protein [Clostridia bacterium]